MGCVDDHTGSGSATEAADLSDGEAESCIGGDLVDYDELDAAIRESLGELGNDFFFSDLRKRQLEDAQGGSRPSRQVGEDLLCAALQNNRTLSYVTLIKEI